MIFYTLQGLNHTLEIHEDSIKLIKRSWWKFLARKEPIQTFDLTELSSFQVVAPKFIWGKIEWTTFQGSKKHIFRFTTHSVMMAKIERYLQKVVIRNYQQKHGLVVTSKKKRPPLTAA